MWYLDIDMYITSTLISFFFPNLGLKNAGATCYMNSVS